jgi:hypothetical protein
MIMNPFTMSGSLPEVLPNSDERLASGCGRLLVSAAKTKVKHTTGGIPRWSPTLVLVARFSAYVWQSGRDAQFSLTYGRMCLRAQVCNI